MYSKVRYFFVLLSNDDKFQHTTILMRKFFVVFCSALLNTLRQSTKQIFYSPNNRQNSLLYSPLFLSNVSTFEFFFKIENNNLVCNLSMKNFFVYFFININDKSLFLMCILLEIKICIYEMLICSICSNPAKT